LGSTTPYLKIQAHVVIALGTPRGTITKTPLTIRVEHDELKHYIGKFLFSSFNYFPKHTLCVFFTLNLQLKPYPLLEKNHFYPMSNVPRTIRSLILWGRSFPERQPSFNVAFIAIRNHFQQEQLMANSFHVIFAFITPLVLNLLGLRYHGNPITPFDTQPITMMVGISCLLAYCFEMKCHVSRLSPTHQPTLLRRSMVLFGSLSLASFVSILFPDSVQLTLLGLYALLVMGLPLHAKSEYSGTGSCR
jgi:hypothetical protein